MSCLLPALSPHSRFTNQCAIWCECAPCYLFLWIYYPYSPLCMVLPSQIIQRAGKGRIQRLSVKFFFIIYVVSKPSSHNRPEQNGPSNLRFFLNNRAFSSSNNFFCLQRSYECRFVCSNLKHDIYLREVSGREFFRGLYRRINQGLPESRTGLVNQS